MTWQLLVLTSLMALPQMTWQLPMLASVMGLPQMTGGGYFHSKLNNSWWHLPRIMEWQICWVHLFCFWLVGWFFLSGSVFSLIVTTLSFDSKGERFPERLLFVGQVCLCTSLVDWLLSLSITQLIFLTSKRDQTLIMHTSVAVLTSVHVQNVHMIGVSCGTHDERPRLF